MPTSLRNRLVPFVLTLSGSKRLFRSSRLMEEHVQALQIDPADFTPPRCIRRKVGIERQEQGGWAYYILTPKDALPKAQILYLHGGSWVFEISHWHWRFLADLVKRTHCRIVVPIYPLAPRGCAESVVPVVSDLIRTMSQGDVPLVLMGDSAGGNIAMAAAVALDEKERQRIAQMILISPALDLSFSDPLIGTIEENDPMLSRAGARYGADLWRRELALDDPRVSPLFADLTGLPPILLFCGDCDCVMPDARALVTKAGEVGVPIVYQEGRGLFHDYPIMPIPEARAAREHIAAVIRKINPFRTLP